MTFAEIEALKKRQTAIQCCASLLHQSSFPAKACVDVVTAMEWLEAEYQASKATLEAAEPPTLETPSPKAT